MDYPMSQVKQVLESLGFEEAEEPGGLIDLIETVEAAPSAERTDTLWLKVPYWRSDISIEDDLVEEVARIVGYDSLPTTMLSTAVPHWQPQPMTELKERVRDLLAAAGMQETISYSPTTLENLSRVDALDDSNPPLRIANPLSREWEYMRTSLRSNVLNTLSYNRRIAQGDGIRIFEVGRVYVPKPEAKERDLPDELEMLVGVVSGPRFTASWAADEADMGFFDAKGALEYALGKLGVEATYEPSEDSIMQPGRTAHVMAGGVSLGRQLETCGPESWSRSTLDAHPAAMFEISLDALLSVTADTQQTYTASSRYPESYRDLALVVDADVPAARIQGIINQARARCR